MSMELNNEQILCIGFPAWEGDYLKSTVQLVGELAKNNRVLYVEYPFTWKDAIMGKIGRAKTPWRRILGKEQRLRSLRLDNGAAINVLTLPPMLPVNFIGNEFLYDTMMGANAQTAYRAIQAAMSELGFHRPVVVNAFNPFLGVFLARQFNEKALIYYCYDEISAAKWAGKHGPRLEKRFMQQADAVITSSQPLFQAKKQYARRSFLVKNGVDFDLFNQPTTVQRPTSTDQRQPSPVVGYLGSLDERIDYNLLESVITRMPHRKFLFVGRINSPEAEKLRRLPNVELAGSQPAASLPIWVQKFGVCIIPFLKNDLTAGIYPLKINEYFAAGKPVVTTSFGDLDDFRRLVTVADTPQAFVQAIEDALQGDRMGGDRHRMAFAHGNSWSKRAAEMGIAINVVLAENRLQLRAGENTWMPDNYNRWGEASAAFFHQKNNSRNTERNPDLAQLLAFS
ncbi:MAG: glycosyltransferase [Saprospiraceae bacterium]|jgi:glycosyltransferase involved in cell wall biosynthesis|nr:glycosyltransferase [Saprospiraceae bacterium]